eukprot:TRINITY_DN9335_c0_g1_i1.p1 TRINITY_DN9335_c0_g1~~TRINITY_DN9335_c0_g1_i1.p1  ORF type:complete len:221 (-),score=9.70 TRINITY_DN9335_c0_g1_i1:40-702(-)
MKCDIGIVANCLFCDSYFVLTVSALDLSDYSDNYGKENLQRLFAKYQERFAKREELVCCSLCMEAAGKSSADNESSYVEECVLCLCRIVEFGMTLPLYLNEANSESKSEWKIIAGHGPAVLEMDSSRSNLIWKKSLSTWGNVLSVYDVRSRSQKDHLYIINTAMEAYQTICAMSEQQKFEFKAADLMERCWSSRPLFQSWNNFAEELENISLSRVHLMEL